MKDIDINDDNNAHALQKLVILHFFLYIVSEVWTNLRSILQ